MAELMKVQEDKSVLMSAELADIVEHALALIADDDDVQTFIEKALETQGKETRWTENDVLQLIVIQMAGVLV